MLETWKVHNFKSIKNETELNLSALTVFAGANSSGKSTFLQSILLTTQTLGNPVQTRPVVLNGKILQLGSMTDLVSRGSACQDITIGFKYSLKNPDFWPSRSRQDFMHYLPTSPDDKLKTLTCEYKFTADTEAVNREQGELQPILLSCWLTTQDIDGVESQLGVSRNFGTAAARAHELGMKLESLTREDLDCLAYRVSGTQDGLEPNPFLFSRRIYFPSELSTGPVAGARLMHFLPSSLALRYDTVAARAENVWQAILGNYRPTFRQKSSEQLLPEAFSNRLAELATEAVPDANPRSMRFHRIERTITEFLELRTTANAVKVMESSPLVREMLSNKRTELLPLLREQPLPVYALASMPVDLSLSIRALLFDRLRYLGPLRDEPKQFYPLEGSADPTDVGLRGEYTAAVLTSHRDTVVSYIAPDDWTRDGANATQTNAPLHKAVLAWLRHLGVVSDLHASDRGVFGHDLRVGVEQDEAVLHSLVHVGVGVSQVLPILVMALIAKPGSILILEQPELHLHPRVQTRLGDFLLSIAMSEKQCLVETHSEYFINRLRLRAAEDEKDTIASVFALYYVSKKEGATHYDKVEVNEYGAVQDWPQGFFDQSPREAEDILRAAVKKRSARRTRRD